MFFAGYIIDGATYAPLTYINMTTEVKFPLTVYVTDTDGSSSFLSSFCLHFTLTILRCLWCIVVVTAPVTLHTLLSWWLTPYFRFVDVKILCHVSWCKSFHPLCRDSFIYFHSRYRLSFLKEIKSISCQMMAFLGETRVPKHLLCQMTVY